mgnify:FL=1
MKNSEATEQLIVDNFYEYIRVKAKRYLKAGYKKYRHYDAFNQPRIRMTKKADELLKTGCKQVVGYRGMTIETAFDGLGIPGFYRLMELFHYKVVKQRIADIGNGIILDEMHLEHMVTRQKMKLYNRVNRK